MAVARAHGTEAANKIAIKILSLGTHTRSGESSPVLGTPTEVMQHIGELTVWSEHSIPNSAILAGGWAGLHSNITVEKLEIEGRGETISNSQLLPDLEFTNHGYSAVTLGTIGSGESKGLLIGGMFKMIARVKKYEYQNTILFEPSTMTWDINQPKTKHTRLSSSASILPDGSPAICGGIGGLTSTEIRGADGEWNLSETAILNLERSQHGTTVVNGTMFAIGGYTRSNESLNSVEIWDPRDNSGWNISVVPPMIEKRFSHSVSSMDDSIFVFGGNPYGTIELNSCESLDTRANRWTPIPPLSSTRSGHSSITSGDQILIMGGNSETTKIDSYDPTTNTWTTIQYELLLSRSSFQAIAL
jgi:hypothetical protein